MIDPTDVLRLIKGRRTVRRFDRDRPVARASLERILEAGTWAPYAPYHPQGWKLVALLGEERDRAVATVCKTQTVLKHIRKMYEESPLGGEQQGDEEHRWKELARDFAQHLGHAPILIVGLVPRAINPTIRLHDVGSVWAAAQNMMLQAHAERLAAGVVTFQSSKVEQELLQLLSLEESEWQVAFLLNVGHPLETPVAPPRRGGLIEIREGEPED